MLFNLASQIPEVGKVAKQLYVIQRHPVWLFPKAEYRYTSLTRFALRSTVLRRLYRAYLFFRGERIWALVFTQNWTANMLRNGQEKVLCCMGAILAAVELTVAIVDVVSSQFMRKSLPDTPRNRDILSKAIPTYPVGCNRVILSPDYLPTLAQDNVELVVGSVAGLNEDSVRIEVSGVALLKVSRWRCLRPIFSCRCCLCYCRASMVNRHVICRFYVDRTDRMHSQHDTRRDVLCVMLSG